jgi:2-methylisocitrate lyase-like PEP mutase family enzyme
MEHRQRNWKRLLKQHKQLLLPSACDALTAKLIQQAGFPAYQIGGFALDGMRFGFPDLAKNPPLCATLCMHPTCRCWWIATTAMATKKA